MFFIINGFEMKILFVSTNFNLQILINNEFWFLIIQSTEHFFIKKVNFHRDTGYY